MNLVAIDIGNSRTKFAISRGKSIDQFRSWEFVSYNNRSVRLPASIQEPAELAGENIAQPKFVIASVNRSGTEKVLSLIDQSISVMTKALVDSESYLPLELANKDVPIESLVDFPERVGIDRLLAGLGAAFLTRRAQESFPPMAAENVPSANLPAEKKLIVVDTGTAVTIDQIITSCDLSKPQKSRFEGGVIFPGIPTMLKSLNRNTSDLPSVPSVLSDYSNSAAPDVIGKNTESAIAAGVYFSHVGAVKEVVGQMTTESNADTFGFLTGGNARSIFAQRKEFPLDRLEWTCEPNLVLLGIAIAYAQLQSS